MRRKIHKEDILEAGLELMYLNGYGSTGIKDITDKVNIPKGSFYNHFKSKEAFGLELIDYYMSGVGDRILFKLSDKSKSPIERLKGIYESAIQIQNEEVHFKLGCFVGNTTQEMGDVNERFNKALSRSFANMQSSFEACIQEGMDKAEIHSRFSAEELADFLINSWQGAMLRMKADKSTAALELFTKIIFTKILS